LGPILFNVFVNDLDAGLEGIPSTFADNSKLGGAADSLEGREALQRDLEKLKSCAITNCMEFSKSSAGFCTWDGAALSIYRLRTKTLKISPTERDLGVLPNCKLNASQQCALTAQRANCALGYHRPSTTTMSGRGCPLHRLTSGSECGFGRYSIRRT